MLQSQSKMLHKYVQKRIPAKFQSLISSDDVLQEVYWSACRMSGALPDNRPDAVERWLTTLAERKLIDAIRSLARTKRGGDRKFARYAGQASTILPLVELVAAEQPSPSGPLSAQELSNAVHLALARLPDKYRLPLTLCHLRGCSRAQAAEQLHLSDSELNNLLHRGLAKLRDILVSSSRFLGGSSGATQRRRKATGPDAAP